MRRVGSGRVDCDSGGITTRPHAGDGESCQPWIQRVLTRSCKENGAGHKARAESVPLSGQLTRVSGPREAVAVASKATA